MDLPSTLRNFQQLKHVKTNDEKYKTATATEQMETERRVERCFDRFEQLRFMGNPDALPILHRIQHLKYLETALQNLTSYYECLDSSRPWMVYWILNATHLLNSRFNDDLLSRAIAFLVKCRAPTGGFGGGPGQLPHLATTYAAVNALTIIGTTEAFDAIDRPSLIRFLYSARDEKSGAFRMHIDGEIDVRGAYCAVSVAKLVNISAEDEQQLFKGTVDWIVSCQTYEGGIGGVPDKEAHGGYTFCGIAALALLGSTGKCNLDKLLKWTVNKQMAYEGGFQGRTNKLVDGCYSFWCGAIMPIVQVLLSKQEQHLAHLLKEPLYDVRALQEYIYICCQRPQGGLLDKPETPPDLYHTCYTLSGVSVAQHSGIGDDPLVIGDQLGNELLPTHPLYNIPPKNVWQAYVHFQNYIVNGEPHATDAMDQGEATGSDSDDHHLN